MAGASKAEGGRRKTGTTKTGTTKTGTKKTKTERKTTKTESRTKTEGTLRTSRLPSSAFRLSRIHLEVVADPDGELRPAEPLAAAAEAVDRGVVREDVIFPALVEERAP